MTKTHEYFLGFESKLLTHFRTHKFFQGQFDFCVFLWVLFKNNQPTNKTHKNPQKYQTHKFL